MQICMTLRNATFVSGTPESGIYTCHAVIWVRVAGPSSRVHLSLDFDLSRYQHVVADFQYYHVAVVVEGEWCDGATHVGVDVLTGGAWRG